MLSCYIYLIVPFWYASAAYQASLVEPWFVFWRDAVEDIIGYQDSRVGFWLANCEFGYGNGENVAVRGAITLWSEPTSSTNYGHGNLFFFKFVSSPIVWYLAVTQEMKCIELSCRAVLNEYRVQANMLKQQKKLLPFYPKEDFYSQK